MKFLIRALPTLLLLWFIFALAAHAQQHLSTVSADRAQEIKDLRQELKRLSARLDELEQIPTTASLGVAGVAPLEAAAPAPAVAATPPVPALIAADAATLSFFRGTTINFGVDGYYGYNFNIPIGRVNLLRAYDVTSNSFNLNQASVIVEHLPTAAERFGGRIDLQYGQATETLQGSSVNEQRPQIFRNLFQVYGSYLAPVGSGLQVDFGKFASSLGNEGNYTKDQVLYSRAYSFNYLPFYHMGFRTSYAVTPKLNATYWLVNGANDTEDLNGFKSQGFIFTYKPASTVSWNVNYYFGQEGRDAVPNGGLPTQNVSPKPDGKEHIFDTYATWNATPKLLFIGEADYVLNRTFSHDRPARVVIGGVTAKYALPHDWNIDARAEYFDDRGGLFSGTTQALKEGTVSLDHTFTPAFLARAEYRRDWSNQRYFLSDTPGALMHAQTTATLGLVYWWGTKQGSW